MQMANQGLCRQLKKTRLKMGSLPIFFTDGFGFREGQFPRLLQTD